VSAPFSGKVNVDIRDSAQDWAPFAPPQAPEGAPNVVYIVLDDVGYSAMSCYGGPIQTPNIDKIAADGVRYTQWHTAALCSPTRSCLLTGRNYTRNSMACITEGASGLANDNGTIPPENGMLFEILGERGWNTYMVGKWHLCPTVEMNLASTRRNWPSAQGVLFSQGSRFGGHALYVKDNRLHYVNSVVGIFEQLMVATEDLPTGTDLILSASFEKDGVDPPPVATGILSLLYGDRLVGQGRIKTQPGGYLIAGEGLAIGRDVGDPVTRDYPREQPNRFTGGTIKRVAVDVSGEPYIDLEREAQAMLMREQQT
jgi:hypothetical protein